MLFISICLTACGGVATLVDPETHIVEASPEALPPQPLSFEPVGDFISGMPIDLAPLPSGNWLVATREGHFVLLDHEFKIIAHQTIPTLTYGDSGLMGFELDPNFETNRFIYIYRTMPDTGGVYENGLIRYTVTENAIILTQPEEIAVLPMLNRYGFHQGGGFAFGPDGYLYLAIGDGSPDPSEIASWVQNEDTYFGKILRIDTMSLEQETVATGLRNPFTAVATDAGLVVADVGGEEFEEVNLQPWGGESNFGWPLEEGPGHDFDSPVIALKHCDPVLQDQDPFRKNHGGIVHECENTSLTVIGELDGEILYSEIFYGLVRGYNPETKEDRHLGHFPGLTACRAGHCVSLFSGNVLEMSN